MSKKIKALENSKNLREKTSNNRDKGGDCAEHHLVIQSLRNVINEQMAKIIEFETYKVQMQQEERMRNIKKKEEGDERS